MKILPTNSNAELDKKLEQFVSKHQLLFTSNAWLKNYDESKVTRCVILNNNDDVIGCFAYYTFKKSVFQLAITPPYSPNVGLFYINPSESVVGKNSFTKDILTLVADYFEALALPYVDINLPDSVIDTQPFIWKGYASKSRYSYLVDLSKTKEELWDNLSSEKRKSVNKAQKDNLVIEATTDNKLVHSLVIKSLERNDVAKNKNILKHILLEFANPSNSFAFVAHHNSVAIGATFCVINNSKAVYLFGGFDAENKHHGAGVSCMWQSILKAKELGLKHFDFEGSMNPKIERYFREFGGELVPYFNVQKVKPVFKTILALKKGSAG